MGLVGGYTADLYCDHPEHDSFDHDGGYPSQYIGQTLGECLKAARKDGWSVNLKAELKEGQNGIGYALCPFHSGKKRKADLWLY